MAAFVAAAVAATTVYVLLPDIFISAVAAVLAGVGVAALLYAGERQHEDYIYSRIDDELLYEQMYDRILVSRILEEKKRDYSDSS